MGYKVTTMLANYPFHFTCEDKATALQCGKRASLHTIEPVDVWKDGKIVEMYKNGRRY